MASGNSYNSYKRGTSLLLYWMVKTSNAIIEDLKNSRHNVALETNATGQVTVSNLIPMSELITKYHPNVPSTIYHLFQSVIKLRSIYHSQFQQLAAASPSEELERKNTTHKYFIDTLTTAFEVLGGEKWLSEEREKRASNDGEDECDADTFAFTNKFSLLDLESDPENEDTLDTDSEKFDNQSAPSLKKRKFRKGKKRVKGKKAKRDCKSSQSDGRALDIALENYRIIEFEDEIGYSMAFVEITRDMVQFRLFLQDVWRKVAYMNLNSAVAATISNIAVAMIKQSQAAIFIDFPGYESYEKIKQTFIHDEDETPYGEILCKSHSESSEKTTRTPTLLENKEVFLIYTYNDLVDFITDYQKTRSGKPTKRLLAQIGNWNPNLDLQKATKEERIKWRRSYTINWLYDLVNITAGVAVHGENAQKENYVLGHMDWSDQGPLKSHQRMFGLVNFAAEVTTLAMQKSGTDFRHKILPHLVFHLQCIVDSWTVSRGWAIGWVKGHILSEPAESFRPRRDLDSFLGSVELEEEGTIGYFSGLKLLKITIDYLKIDGKGLEHIKDCIKILDKLDIEFQDALGNCKVFDSLSAFIPSRFASTNPNGAWDYSPFFCGAGLAEGLELVYRSTMLLWEGMSEPMLIVHLHSMLVKEGYLKQPTSLYSGLGLIFSDSFFSGGQPPTSDYVGALRSQLDKISHFRRSQSSSQSSRQRKSISRKAMNGRAVGKATNTRDLLDLAPLHLFKQKSSLLMYGSADWDPDRVPESDIDPLSALGLIRLSQTRRVRDPATSVWQFEETDLVKRARVAGMNESFYTENLGPLFEDFRDERQAEMDLTRSVKDRAPDICDTNKASKKRDIGFRTTKKEITAGSVLRFLYKDIHGDVCGDHRPLSSICYMVITMQMLVYFHELEPELQKSSSNTSNQLFAGDAESNYQCNLKSYNRLQVTLDALGGKDTKLLSSVVKVFETYRDHHILRKHWGAEDDEAETRRGPVREDSIPEYCRKGEVVSQDKGMA